MTEYTSANDPGIRHPAIKAALAASAPLPSTFADVPGFASQAAVRNAPVTSIAIPHIPVVVHQSIVDSLKSDIAKVKASAERWEGWYDADVAEAKTLWAGVKQHKVALVAYSVFISGVTMFVWWAV